MAGGGGDWKEREGASKSLERVRLPEDEGDALRALCACSAHDPHGLPTRSGPPLHVTRPHSCPCARCAHYALLALDDEGLLTRLRREMADFCMEPPLAKTLIASVNLGVFQGDPVYRFNVVCSEYILLSQGET